jgi:hypothetical protein
MTAIYTKGKVAKGRPQRRLPEFAPETKSVLMAPMLDLSDHRRAIDLEASPPHQTASSTKKRKFQ